MTDEEIEALTKKTEVTLEAKIKAIHQSLYDNIDLKTALSTNEKLYLFCGLIMAGLKTEGVKALEYEDLYSNDSESNNDGTQILQNINSFLSAKSSLTQKTAMIINLLSGVFKKKIL